MAIFLSIQLQKVRLIISSEADRETIRAVEKPAVTLLGGRWSHGQTAGCSTLLNPSLRGFTSARNERTKYISQRHGGKTCPERSRRAVPFSKRLTRSRSLETTPPRALTHRQLGRPSIPGHVPPFPTTRTFSSAPCAPHQSSRVARDLEGVR